jgi:isopenicillin-N N-acyltransferase-like protein
LLPVIQLTGPPLAQGLTHGREARERVAHNLAAYFARFRIEGGLSREGVLAIAEPYWAAMQTEHPDYAAAVRGVAEGAGEELMAVVALNIRYEILYHLFAAQASQFGAQASQIAAQAGQFAAQTGGFSGPAAIASTPAGPRADGCTAFAVQPSASADGHLLLGQNWDWYPEVMGAVLHTCEEGFESLCFTEAGIVGGKIGLNSAGLGLAINGLISEGDDLRRLATPFHVRCHAILRQRDIDAAVAIVRDGDRSCSANFLLGQAPDRVVDIEAAPRVTRAIAPEGGVIAHSNHFWDPDGMGIVEPASDTRPYSKLRLERCQRLLVEHDGGIGVADAMAFLRDHDGYPQSLCRHPDARRPETKQSATVTSVLMDLHDRAMWISDGPPCQSPYQALRLSRSSKNG